MKALHLITSTRSFFEQQVLTLEERGVECTVIGVPGDYRAESPRTPLDYLRFYPEVLSQVRREEYDLVHANYGLVAPFALAQPTRPVVLSLWGTDLMSEMGWLRRLSRFGAQRADAVVVPSPAMSRRLDVDHELIPFGIDTSLFRPIPRDEARAQVGWETDRTIVLFPYDPARSVKDFPRAQRIVDRASVDVELRAVTDVPHDQMPYYMNASDVLLVTSKRESGPLTVKEAAACNLPVISTDVGFVRETIEGVENCAVGTSDEGLTAALEYVVEDGGRSDGRDAIDELGLESMGDRLVGLYERVLGDVEAGRPALERVRTNHGI